MKRWINVTVATAFAAAISFTCAPSAQADQRDEEARMNIFIAAVSWLSGLEGKTSYTGVKPFRHSAVVDLGIAERYRLDNFNATVEAGEPTDGGRIKRTMWARFTPGVDARIVIDTPVRF